MERSADNRIRTTEWEDVQYKYGNKVGKYATNELGILAQKLADKNQDACLKAYDASDERVTDKLERGGYECEEGRDGDREAILDPDDEDDALALIRQRRLAELKKQKKSACFGVLRHIPGSDYVSEVTDGSEKNAVVALLVKPGQSDCEALLTVMRSVAQRHAEVKFVSMVSTEAIPNFPDRHLPCVLIYRNKELKDQLTGMDAWRHKGQFNVDSVERTLRSESVLAKVEEQDDD